MKSAVTFLMLLASACPACASDEEKCMKSVRDEALSDQQSEFHREMERFLAAVKSRDRGTFNRYLDSRVFVTALLPGGKVFKDVEAFQRSQDGWFEGATGRFDYQIERTDSTGDLGFAWAKVTYANSDAGTDFELGIYITFVFRRLDGRWYLTHDQNTVVSDSRRP